MPSVQTLDARYIDGQALLALLTRLFGAGNFKIDHVDDIYKLTVPTKLSRDQELSVRINV